MKPQLLKLSSGQVHSFRVRRDEVPYINNRWHYHSELELIHFEKGHGSQFIGDNIQSFQSGDLVLIGSQLPHYWRFDDVYFDGLCRADVRVVHFSKTFWGECFLDLPENKKIKDLLEQAKAGVLSRGKTAEDVAKLMDALLDAEGTNKIILLLQALTQIAESRDYRLLSSTGFRAHVEEADDERINAVYEYSLKHFKRKIELKQVATIANVSPNSFCRYFKLRTGKTYSQFMLEVRVGQACRLLIENRMSVKQICYESGFHNVASFHKYFKQITGKSPLNYQKEFTDKKGKMRV